MTDATAARKQAGRIAATADRAARQAALFGTVWDLASISVGASTVDEAVIKGVEIALRRVDRELPRDRFHARVWVDEAFDILDDAQLNGFADRQLHAQLWLNIHEARASVEGVEEGALL